MSARRKSSFAIGTALTVGACALAINFAAPAPVASATAETAVASDTVGGSLTVAPNGSGGFTVISGSGGSLND